MSTFKFRGDESEGIKRGKKIFANTDKCEGCAQRTSKCLCNSDGELPSVDELAQRTYGKKYRDLPDDGHEQEFIVGLYEAAGGKMPVVNEAPTEPITVSKGGWDGSEGPGKTFTIPKPPVKNAGAEGFRGEVNVDPGVAAENKKGGDLQYFKVVDKKGTSFTITVDMNQTGEDALRLASEQLGIPRGELTLKNTSDDQCEFCGSWENVTGYKALALCPKCLEEYKARRAKAGLANEDSGAIGLDADQEYPHDVLPNAKPCLGQDSYGAKCILPYGHKGDCRDKAGNSWIGESGASSGDQMWDSVSNSSGVARGAKAYGSVKNATPLGGSKCPDCGRGILRLIVGEDHRYKCDSCKATFRDDVKNDVGSFKLVEKKDHYAVHGIFDSRERAEQHLAMNIPEYCRKGFFMDKTLTPDSFEIIPSTKKNSDERAQIITSGGGASGWIIADIEGRRLFGPFPSYSAADADFKRRNLVAM